MSKTNKLDLIENRSKVNMGSVLKQIAKLRQENDVVRASAKNEELEMG
jgi:hypothetical protein